MKKRESPILGTERQSFQVTCGNVRVKCYTGQDGRWFVTHSVLGKRRTEAFREKKTASDRGAEPAAALYHQQTIAKTLPMNQILGCLDAMTALEPFDISLSGAIREYVAAKEKLRGVSLSEAIEFYCRHNVPDVPSK